MLEVIKKIREMTGAGVVNVKKALDEAKGDEAKAIEILKKQGHDKALKKADREAGEGVIATYVHSNDRVGAMIKLLCETDFVARNEEFKELANDLAMHVTAMNPKYLNPEDVPVEDVEKEKEIWVAQLKEEGKPENIMENILKGKEGKFREEVSLLTQDFVKDPSKKIKDLIAEKVGKIGENIQVGGFIRYEI